jgi:hypothetical protein
MVWSEEKFQEFVAAMESDNPNLKVSWFQGLLSAPSGDARVLPYLEAALEDATICLVGAPIMYAELRLEAATALARERKVQGNIEPVILLQTVGRLYGERNNQVSQIINENDEFLKAHYKPKNSEQNDYDAVEKKLNFLRESSRLELRDYWVMCTETGASALLPIPKT